MAADRQWLERVLQGLGAAMDAEGLRRALLRRGASPDEIDRIFAVLTAKARGSGTAPVVPADGRADVRAAKPSSI